MHSQSIKEKIELLAKQISVVTKRVERSKTDKQRQHYSAALQELEGELDELVLPTSK
jgi:hypothetical protein